MLPLLSRAESVLTLAPPQLRGFRRLCTTVIGINPLQGRSNATKDYRQGLQK